MEHSGCALTAPGETPKRIAIGESIKGVEKLSDRKLRPQYPEIDWKGAMEIRDIIAHHYFDLDAEILYNVVKQNLPDMLVSIDRILHKITP